MVGCTTSRPSDRGQVDTPSGRRCEHRLGAHVDGRRPATSARAELAADLGRCPRGPARRGPRRRGHGRRSARRCPLRRPRRRTSRGQPARRLAVGHGWPHGRNRWQARPRPTAMTTRTRPTCEASAPRPDRRPDHDGRPRRLLVRVRQRPATPAARRDVRRHGGRGARDGAREAARRQDWRRGPASSTGAGTLDGRSRPAARDRAARDLHRHRLARSDDVAEARREVQRVVDAQHGTITEENTETDDEGDATYARLVMRVPERRIQRDDARRWRRPPSCGPPAAAPRTSPPRSSTPTSGCAPRRPACAGSSCCSRAPARSRTSSGSSRS